MAKVAKVGCWIAITILSIALVCSVFLNIGMVAALFAAGSTNQYDYPVDETPVFEEVWSYGSGDTKVVRIDLSGTISRGQIERLLGSDPDMVESILAQIQAAENDPYVMGILLDVDSPGGAVTPSDEIYAALRKFKASDEERRILVFIRDLGASGAYYAAMAGDHIIAEPTAIVGSVGVIMQSVNAKELGDMIGLKSVTIASGVNKDMLNPLEEVNPRHLEMLQGLVDEMQDRFASIVQESRGLDGRELLDGRVFTAGKALEHGLIDEIGYWPDAVEAMDQLLGSDGIFIVRYSRPTGLIEALLGVKTPRIPSLDLNATDEARFLYQWKP